MVLDQAHRGVLLESGCCRRWSAGGRRVIGLASGNNPRPDPAAGAFHPAGRVVETAAGRAGFHVADILGRARAGRDGPALAPQMQQWAVSW